MNLLRTSLYWVLSAQLVMGPVALAQESTVERATREVPALQERVTGELTANERVGWRYYNSDRHEIRASEVMAAVARNNEYWALTPHLEDVGAKVAFRIRTEGARDGRFSVRFEVFHRDLMRRITGRMIHLYSDTARAEENALRYRRALRSMTDEVIHHRGELAASGVLEKALWAIGNALLPEAQANREPVGLSTALQSAASVSCTLGVIALFLGGDLGRRAHYSLVAALFIVALVTYIAGGYFADQDARRNAPAPR